MVSSTRFAIILPVLLGAVFISPATAQIALSPATHYATQASSPRFVAVADLNGDRQPDMVSANYHNSNETGTVSVFLNTGGGSFRRVANYYVGRGPQWVGIADFTGDSIPDVATLNTLSGNVSVLTGVGDGSFFVAAVNSPLSGTPSPMGGAIGDFNRDGRPDLAVTNTTTPTAYVTILLNQGLGVFAAKSWQPVGANPQCVTAGDFNSDGNLDVAVAGSAANAVNVLVGDGAGNISPRTTIDSKVNPFCVESADFDQDGRLDLAWSSNLLGGVVVAKGNGNGTFGTPVRYPTAANSSSGSICVGEFSGDNKPDLVVTTTVVATGVRSFQILMNKGDGTFDITNSVTYPGITFSVLAADVDGGGLSDVVVTNYSNQVTVYVNQTTFVNSFTVDPPQFANGGFTKATIVLSSPAPASGSIINLVSTDPGVAQAPPTVTVKPNETTISFYVTGHGVGDASIVAEYNGRTARHSVNVVPGGDNPPPAGPPGDANGDGLVNIDDAVEILKSTGGMSLIGRATKK